MSGNGGRVAEQKLISHFVVFTSKFQPPQLEDGDFDTLGRCCFLAFGRHVSSHLGVPKFPVKAMASRKGHLTGETSICVEDLYPQVNI